MCTYEHSKRNVQTINRVNKIKKHWWNYTPEQRNIAIRWCNLAIKDWAERNEVYEYSRNISRICAEQALGISYIKESAYKYSDNLVPFNPSIWPITTKRK